jgi:hypothetical protein
MLGFYENFPSTIHLTEAFTSSLSKRKLQEKIIQVFQEVNRKTFSFEEICNPSVSNGTVIFEFGIAEAEAFNYLDADEAQKLLRAIDRDAMQVMDWFCSIRYYKNVEGKRCPLRFDYYIFRMRFGEKERVEFLVFHERGPRYVSPEELVFFIEHKVNQKSSRINLKLLQGH